jgi:ubiquinone/menaquinone biosynthesis C-methylase UbiE
VFEPWLDDASLATMVTVGTGFSFELVNAEDYDALRPEYAPEAVAWLVDRCGLDEGSLVVDLAAGTGQLSRRFADTRVGVVTVEPARNMRLMIKARLPSVRAVGGSAEAIPLGESEADAIVVGNAFHHFDADRAFGEIRRVLRPSGAIALFWAWPAEDSMAMYPRLRQVDEAMEKIRGSTAIAAAYRSWKELPTQVEGFSPFERADFPTIHEVPSARLADLYATSSDVASLPPRERAGLLERIKDASRELPEILRFPTRTVVDLSFRQSGRI